MLTDETLIRYYANKANFIIFNDFCTSMRTYFEDSEWQSHNLDKWHSITIEDVIAINSNVSVTECLRKMWSQMNIIQRDLNHAYHDSIRLRENIIRVCRNHSALIFALINSSMNNVILMNNLQSSIINYEIVKNHLSFINSIIRKMKPKITISLIDSIDEKMNHHMIVEMNHLIVELNFIEMNLVTINQMIDFKIVVSRNASYVTNSIVDQSITQIRSEKIQRSDFQIVFLNSKTVIVFINTSANTKAQTRMTIMMRWFSILKNFQLASSLQASLRSSLRSHQRILASLMHFWLSSSQMSCF
jgi:hypothetical protein